MEMEMRIFLTAGFGAVLQELIHWYGLRAKLELDKYQNTLKSKWYWVVTLGMVLAAGIGTMIWFADAGQNTRSQDYMLFGFSFPLIIKKLGTAYAASRRRTLGKADSGLTIGRFMSAYLN